jgi:hypothetical protein
MSHEEAIALLDTWRRQGKSLRIFFVRTGANREFRATIGELTASAVELMSASETSHVELEGAEFNGDTNSAASSDYQAYLVCELRNGDRCYFYLPRVKPLSARDYANGLFRIRQSFDIAMTGLVRGLGP